MSQYTLYEKREFARKMRQEPTEAEAFLWERIRRNALGYTFQRQRTVYGYIVDFWCPRARLAIEVDGSVHNIEEVAAKDEQKEIVLSGYKIGLLRFTNDEVLNSPAIVLRDIRRECDYLMQLQTPLRGVGFDFRAKRGKKQPSSTNSSMHRGNLRNPVEELRYRRTRGPLPSFTAMCKSFDTTRENCGRERITPSRPEELLRKTQFPPDPPSMDSEAWRQKRALAGWLKKKGESA